MRTQVVELQIICAQHKRNDGDLMFRHYLWVDSKVTRLLYRLSLPGLFNASNLNGLCRPANTKPDFTDSDFSLPLSFCPRALCGLSVPFVHLSLPACSTSLSLSTTINDVGVYPVSFSLSFFLLLSRRDGSLRLFHFASFILLSPL